MEDGLNDVGKHGTSGLRGGPAMSRPTNKIHYVHKRILT